MVNPVTTDTGNTYERTNIVEHFKRYDTDPLTNVQVKHKILTPCPILRNQIQAYMNTTLPTPEDKQEYEEALYKKNMKKHLMRIKSVSVKRNHRKR